MGLFDSLDKAVVSVAITPVTALADVVTLGGLVTDQDEPYTSRALKAAMKNAMDAVERDE